MKSKRDIGLGKSDEDVELTIKRKWQIALRRYVLEGNPSVSYAPYFGLTSALMRKWIEVQFKDHMKWDNFGKAWNLTQKVPVHLFNLKDDKELSLCWHFINIAVQDLKENTILTSIDLFSTKQFYRELHKATSFEKCRMMLDKLEDIESTQAGNIRPLETFIRENLQTIDSLTTFDGEDYARVNHGEELQAILMEKEIIKKYGS